MMIKKITLSIAMFLLCLTFALNPLVSNAQSVEGYTASSTSTTDKYTLTKSGYPTLTAYGIEYGLGNAYGSYQVGSVDNLQVIGASTSSGSYISNKHLFATQAGYLMSKYPNQEEDVQAALQYIACRCLSITSTQSDMVNEANAITTVDYSYVNNVKFGRYYEVTTDFFGNIKIYVSNDRLDVLIWDASVPSLTIQVNGGASQTGTSLENAITSTNVALGSIAQLEITAGDFTTADWQYLEDNRDNLNALATFTITDNINTVADIPDTDYNNPYFNTNSITTVSVAKVTSIGNDAFYNCSSLTTASFPQATSIGDYAFYNCGALATLQLGATPPTVGGSDVFNGSPTPRNLVLVDATGNPLTTGQTYDDAKTAYDTAEASTPNDGLWYGWTIAPTVSPVDQGGVGINTENPMASFEIHDMDDTNGTSLFKITQGESNTVVFEIKDDGTIIDSASGNMTGKAAQPTDANQRIEALENQIRALQELVDRLTNRD